MSKKMIIITTHSSVPGFSGEFGRYRPDQIDEIPNVVAKACAQAALKADRPVSHGMWTASVEVTA